MDCTVTAMQGSHGPVMIRNVKRALCCPGDGNEQVGQRVPLSLAVEFGARESYTA